MEMKPQNAHGDGEIVSVNLLQNINGNEKDNRGGNNSCIDLNGNVETKYIPEVVVTHFLNDSIPTKEFDSFRDMLWCMDLSEVVIKDLD